MPKGIKGFQKGHGKLGNNTGSKGKHWKIKDTSNMSKARIGNTNGFQKGIYQGFGFKKGLIPWNKDKMCSRLAGKNNGMWKGDNVGYDGMHHWLKTTFGKADKCENPDCKGKSKTFEWSLLKGKKYERRRENFWQLCVICHRIYDNS